MSRQKQKISGLHLKPITSDPEEWSVYWTALGWPWRILPEIEVDRQEQLAKHSNILPDVSNSIYPFKNIEPKLTRADIEWLLVNCENGLGPIDWSDRSQRERKGLDLRGANLSQVNLQGLPLAGIIGGIEVQDRLIEREMAAIHLEGADLSFAHLEGANLVNGHLEDASLNEACLDGADIWHAHLNHAWLGKAQMHEAILCFAELEGASLIEADLKGTNLLQANLEHANLLNAQLREVFLNKAHLEGCILTGIHLEGADLSQAYLGGNSKPAAIMDGAFFDASTNLKDVTLGNAHSGFVSLCDVHWGDANLSVVDWSPLNELGDERAARAKKSHISNVLESEGAVVPGYEEQRTNMSIDILIMMYRRAVRANRRLSMALQDQGLNEEAARFAYRAQRLQRMVFMLQGQLGQHLFSLFIDLLAGYGYRLRRSFLAYLLVILLFALTYYFVSPTVGISLSPLEAIVFSVTSFHGRGFSPGENIGLGNPLTVLAAIEAFVGLIIEVVFIATLTQRFFRK